ncbi:MAG: hypothetical protein H6595_12695 [Flavobacteriales bacterium]|nr:hypothetical protein [Flavobacteriales bacterium]MCB9168321.1 hypothetical protein [Flavobacteriales bacterium]
MRKWMRRLLFTLLGIAVMWTALTVWVEAEGPANEEELGPANAPRHALVVYDPDPIYDLDAQVCHAFAEGLVTNGYNATVATVAAARRFDATTFDLLVLCANTYNWRPDRAIQHYVKDLGDLGHRPVFAITLGSGSTEDAQHVFEELVQGQAADLVASKTLWLMRPNDEARMEESNVDVATDMARQWGREQGLP